MLLPLDLREWVPDNHLVHFVVEAVDGLPMAGFKINHRGTGDAQQTVEPASESSRKPWDSAAFCCGEAGMYGAALLS